MRVALHVTAAFGTGRFRRSYAEAANLLTRSRYSPVRVSTLIMSPMSTNAGTMISAPVSILTGLVKLVAVLPLIEGSQYSMASTT